MTFDHQGNYGGLRSRKRRSQEGCEVPNQSDLREEKGEGEGVDLRSREPTRLIRTTYSQTEPGPEGSDGEVEGKVTEEGREGGTEPVETGRKQEGESPFYSTIRHGVSQYT